MKRFALLLALVCCAAAPPPYAAAKRSKPDVYAVRARRELAEFNAKIEALEVQAREMGAEARAGAEERLGGLRLKKSDADRALDKVEAAAGKAGKDLRAGLDRALRDLRAAYAEATAGKKS